MKQTRQPAGLITEHVTIVNDWGLRWTGFVKWKTQNFPYLTPNILKIFTNPTLWNRARVWEWTTSSVKQCQLQCPSHKFHHISFLFASLSSILSFHHLPRLNLPTRSQLKYDISEQSVIILVWYGHRCMFVECFTINGFECGLANHNQGSKLFVLLYIFWNQYFETCLLMFLCNQWRDQPNLMS